MKGVPDPFGDGLNLLELASRPAFRGLPRHQLTLPAGIQFGCHDGRAVGELTNRGIHKETLEPDPFMWLMLKMPNMAFGVWEKPVKNVVGGGTCVLEVALMFNQSSLECPSQHFKFCWIHRSAGHESA